ncbi:MAG: helix-turn-helix domain-containing protein [Candidatus Cloacimonas sp.]|nr:helix-turn-helix domain-containing protein [Candidatus Cloacimonas sp.]
MEDRWLSTTEICIYLGVTKNTIYVWLSKRELPAHKICRIWKFKK